MSATASTLITKKRHPLLGTEVRGVDLARPLDRETFREIEALWLSDLLLVFPEQRIADEAQIAFARNFGALEIHPSVSHRSSRNPEIYRISNLDERGAVLPRQSTQWQYMELTRLWHTDSSFREVPSKGSILHAIELPPEGGDTLFANMYAAYEALDTETRTRIRGLRVRHSHDHIIRQSETLSARADKGEYAELPPVVHPLVQRHPVTGRTSLFLSPHTMEGVEGMPDADGRALLGALIAHATSGDFTYRHQWQLDDVIMWDNRCTMHAVIPFDESRHCRELHRTTLIGDGPPIAA